MCIQSWKLCTNKYSEITKKALVSQMLNLDVCYTNRSSLRNLRVRCQQGLAVTLRHLAEVEPVGSKRH
jgi:hypothetical protein